MKKNLEKVWQEKRDEIAQINEAGPMDSGIIDAVTAIQILGIPTIASCEGHVVKMPTGEPTTTWQQYPALPMIVCGIHPQPYLDYYTEEMLVNYPRHNLSNEQLSYIDNIVCKNNEYIKKAVKILDIFYAGRPHILTSERLIIDTSFGWYWQAFTIMPQLRESAFAINLLELETLVVVGRREFMKLSRFVHQLFFNGELNEAVL